MVDNAVEMTVRLAEMAGWRSHREGQLVSLDIKGRYEVVGNYPGAIVTFRPWSDANDVLLLARALVSAWKVLEFNMSEGENGGITAWVWLVGQDYRDRTFKRGLTCVEALFLALCEACGVKA